MEKYLYVSVAPGLTNWHNNLRTVTYSIYRLSGIEASVLPIHWVLCLGRHFWDQMGHRHTGASHHRLVRHWHFWKMQSLSQDIFPHSTPRAIEFQTAEVDDGLLVPPYHSWQIRVQPSSRIGVSKVSLYEKLSIIDEDLIERSIAYDQIWLTVSGGFMTTGSSNLSTRRSKCLADSLCPRTISLVRANGPR